MYNFSFKKEEFKMAVHRDPSIRKHAQSNKNSTRPAYIPCPTVNDYSGCPCGGTLEPCRQRHDHKNEFHSQKLSPIKQPRDLPKLYTKSKSRKYADVKHRAKFPVGLFIMITCSLDRASIYLTGRI